MTIGIDRLAKLRELMQKNGYSGKYRNLFEDTYEEILEAKEVILSSFEDGFQLKDLEDIFVVAAPILKEIYDGAVPLLKDKKEAKKFLRDLIIFVYYEIEPHIKSWGFVKFIFRIALRLWIAGKIANYIKLAFDWADGKVVMVLNSVPAQKAAKIFDALN